MKAARLSAFVVAFLLAALARAQHFTTFPDRSESRSPDGRFVIRSVEQSPSALEFSGVFRSLVLEQVGSGRSQILYRYLGRAAVAWSGNFIIVTDYAGKRTARALVFAIGSSIGDAGDPLPLEQVTLDKTQLARSLPSEQDVHLLENDHVYVEAARVEGDLLLLRVWGYGKRDPNGFRWDCQYDLRAGTASCKERSGGGPLP